MARENMFVNSVRLAILVGDEDEIASQERVREIFLRK
jgi:hypothetical protein